MACPYFKPAEPLPQSSGKAYPAPLGDLWLGTCRASSGALQPDQETVRQFCNFGYARGRCGRMPPGGPDAVRFSVSDDRGDLIRIYWVMEQQHLPFAHGPLTYSREGEPLEPVHPDACVAAQAQAYVDSYRRRKEASARS